MIAGPNTNLFMIDIEGTELSTIEQQILKHRHVGSVLLFTRNFQNTQQLEKLITEIQTINPRIFIAVDHEGGNVQRFQRQGFTSIPAARVFGAIYDKNTLIGTQIAEQYGEIMAAELVRHGVDLSIAPVLDILDKNPVIGGLDRAFHAEPEAVIHLAGAFIGGMARAKMPSVVKHFPGHGSVIGDSHSYMPTSHTSLDELMEKDLKPFIELIKQELVTALMPAHVTYTAIDNKPAGFSKIWLQDILRSQLGFKGVVLSDCLSMKGADIGDLKTRAEQALNAGCDMLIVCHQPRHLLLELLETLSVIQSPESADRIIQFTNKMNRFSDLKEEKSVEQVFLEHTEPHQEHFGLNDKYNTTLTI